MTPIKIPLNKSLSYQQTKNTVVVAFIIGVILSCIQIYIDYFSEKTALRESVSNTLATADSAAFHAAFNLDGPGAKQITQGLVSGHSIIEATIFDDLGNVLGSAKKPTKKPTPTAYSWFFGPLEIISHELTNENIYKHSVGQLRIVIDPSFTAEAFVQRSVLVFTSGIVRNIILAISIFIVFYLTFTRPILRASTHIIKGRDQIQIDMPSNHQDDEIGALIGTFNDHIALIEEQNQQISEANENLEHLVATRTKQLDERNKELELERSLAIEASMAKSDFLAMMSHEVRTPMNGILGMAELLGQYSKDSRQKDYVDSIIESSKSLLALMNSVLDYSKYEQDQINFEHQPFDPVRLINSIIFLLSASAEKKHIVLSLDIASELPPLIIGDPEKLRQVLLNLITNAIKFTHEGHVTLTVKTIPNNPPSSDKAHLQFIVEDSGIGMADGVIEQIFEPYTQANNGISQRFGGTGMGLAICKQIIEQQGGEIYCDSVEHSGSKFIFELCFEVSNQTAPDQDSPLELPQLHSLRVLVVDDLSINRKLVKGQLESEGHSAFLASSGQQALDIIEQQPLDAVLMDLHMPDMDGIAATHHIRQGSHSTLPIIGITANVSEQKIEECLAAGMDIVITKPVDQPKLVKSLQQVLFMGRAHAVAPPAKQQEQCIDQLLINQHLQSLGETKFIALYEEARESAYRRIDALTHHGPADFVTIADDAHALAGLCANFGLLELCKKVESIELDCQQESIDAVSEKITMLITITEKTFAALNQAFPAIKK